MAPLDVDKFKTLSDNYNEFKTSFCSKYSNLKAWGKFDKVISHKRITAVGELLDYLKDTEDFVYDNWEDKKLMEKVSQDNIDLLLGETIPMPKEILDIVSIANNKSNHETKFEKFQENGI